jgi:hypothetical protein
MATEDIMPRKQRTLRCCRCDKARQESKMNIIVNSRGNSYSYCRDTCTQFKIAPTKFKVNDAVKYKYRKTFGFIYDVISEPEEVFKVYLSYTNYHDFRNDIELQPYYKIHWASVSDDMLHFLKHYYSNNCYPQIDLTKIRNVKDGTDD